MPTTKPFPPREWTLLVYRLPSQPTRLRLAVWRQLQKTGALYLQDGVCVLPTRDDLAENLTYVAAMVQEMEGTCYLFSSRTLLPQGDDELTNCFRALADQRLTDIATRLEPLRDAANSIDNPHELAQAEDTLRRERLAFLRAEKLAYCGASPEHKADVSERLNQIKRDLDGTGGK